MNGRPMSRQGTAMLSTAFLRGGDRKVKGGAGVFFSTAPAHLASKPKQRIFSGIQATGKLHLGNYLGAISNWVRLQKEHHRGDEGGHDDHAQIIFGIMDLHSLTNTTLNPADLRESTMEVAIALLACGIDPTKTILYPQSWVSGHAELAWILGCRTSIGALNRMTQYKEKKATQGSMLGLFSYPVLMAADILLYRATHVPVGDDQTQHLELTRNIAESFNNHYKTDFFPLPTPTFTQFQRVMSLRDGTKKMSKSDESDKSRINLTDTKEEIEVKIRKAKTDSTSSLSFDPKERPEVSNLLNMYSSLSAIASGTQENNNYNDSYSHKSLTVAEVVERFQGKDTLQFKEELARLAVAKLAPIGERIRELRANPEFVERTLREGARKADEVATRNLAEIKRIVGLL
ncbi:Tryptophan--tRNA ligase, mitochondrial [Balamuthia mandrillaris]